MWHKFRAIKKASCTIWRPAQKAFERLQMDNKSNSHPKSSSFIFSTFTRKIDTTPREVSETWPQFIKRLSEPAIRANKDGPLWSPATFKPACRKKENVKTVSLLMLDID